MKSKIFNDLSREDIHLQFKGDFDKQFQYLANAVVDLEEIVDKKSGSKVSEVDKELANTVIVMSKTIEDMNSRLNDLEKATATILPDANSVLKPDDVKKEDPFKE